MKICIICPQWGYFGGREQYLIDAVDELSKRGHVCFLIYEELTKKSVTSTTAKNILKYCIPILGELETNIDMHYAKMLRHILEKERPDVVFINDIKNIVLLKYLVEYGKLVAMMHYGWLFCLRNVRVLYFSRNACYQRLSLKCFLHGCFFRKSQKASRILLCYNSLKKHLILIRLYMRIDRHVVASSYMKNLFLQHGFKDYQVEIISLFTETPMFHVGKSVIKEPVIVFIGRIDRYKGVDCLLMSLCNIKLPFKCFIVGEGSFLPHCKKLSHKLGLEKSVTFLGWLPREDTKTYLKDASIVVVPSIMPEAFGMVGLEAMAYGKPVVAFNNGGISDWLKDGVTGYLVPTKNLTTMTKKIDYLLRNPEHAHELGVAGRHSVEQMFDKGKHFNKLIRVFEDACRRQPILSRQSSI